MAGDCPKQDPADPVRRLVVTLRLVRSSMNLTRVLHHPALAHLLKVLLEKAAMGENDPGRGGVQEVHAPRVNDASASQRAEEVITNELRL